MYTSPELFAKALTAAGVPIPKAAAGQLAALAAVREAGRPSTPPAADSSEAVTADTADAAVAALATEMVIDEKRAQASLALIQPVSALFAQVIRGAQVDLLAKLAARFDAAAVIVQAAGQHFGPNPRPEDVLNAGLAAVDIYNRLTGALDDLTAVRSARVQLGDIAGHGEQRVEWWIAGAADDADLDRARRTYYGPGHMAHALAREGFTLRLNTPVQAQAVSAGASAATAQQVAATQAAEAALARDGWQDTFTAGARMRAESVTTSAAT